jgi:hypothetical protein
MNKFTLIGWHWEDHPHGSRSIGSRYSCSDLQQHVLKSTTLLTGEQQTTSLVLIYLYTCILSHPLDYIEHSSFLL